MSQPWRADPRIYGTFDKPFWRARTSDPSYHLAIRFFLQIGIRDVSAVPARTCA
jgi:hypothetical protein